MPFPYYIAGGDFQEVNLKDANDNDFGSLYLCPNGTNTNDWPTVPPSAPVNSAAAIPIPPATVWLFQSVFDQLASVVALHLNEMNAALLQLHLASAHGSNPSQIQGTTWYAQYLAAASRFVQVLQLGQANKQNFCKFWPLVPFNRNSNMKLENGFKSIVSTLDIENPDFPAIGNTKHALPFYVTVPVNVTTVPAAMASIAFYQDCNWLNSTDDKSWVSWGFVECFALNLLEEVPSVKRVASSSSSSSYYAPGSSLPGTY